MAVTDKSRTKQIAEKAKVAEAHFAVPWQNGRSLLPEINIELSVLLLHNKSHRIRAQIESHPDRNAVETDPWSDNSQKIIEQLLAETPGYPALKDNLNESGQLETGIISRSGVIINGNTRAAALRSLNIQYMRVAVLPEDATEPEIYELEARLQLTRDYKQDYTLVNELIYIKEQIDAGLTTEDLAVLLGKAQSRNQAHLRVGVQKIEQGLRILAHIRDIQARSNGAIPVIFFDPHESALLEGDRAYMSLVDKDSKEAERVRDGRMTGVLVGVTYRNLRQWDSDDFVEDYLTAELEADVSDVIQVTQDEYSSDEDLGIEGLDDDYEEPALMDATNLLNLTAQHFGSDDGAAVTDALTKSTMYTQVQEAITTAAEEKADFIKQEKKLRSPMKHLKDARTDMERATKAYPNAKSEVGFKLGDLKYELNKIRGVLDGLDKLVNS